MFRAYRLGQTKPVYIYRNKDFIFFHYFAMKIFLGLMVKGTMEEKLYKRQIAKQAMSERSYHMKIACSRKKIFVLRCDRFQTIDSPFFLR